MMETGDLYKLPTILQELMNTESSKAVKGVISETLALIQQRITYSLTHSSGENQP